MELVRELREHCDQLAQWATFLTPSYEQSSPDDDYKQVLSLLGDVYARGADDWMDELTSYHAGRAENVFDVRTRSPYDTARSIDDIYVRLRQS